MKLKKKLKIVILCIVLLVVAIGAVTLLYASPIFLMKPAATGYIEDTKVIAVNNQSNNLFFINTEDGYILIDAGSDIDTVTKGLNEMSIDPATVKYIFLTHTDYDHVASLNLFANAQIFLSASEKQMVDGTTKRSLFSGNSLPDGVSLDRLTLLSADEKMEIGNNTVECIDSPGHTPGSMIYLINDNYLFTGDAFKVSDDVISVHPYSMDKKLAQKTIGTLDTLWDRSEMVFTSHYGYFDSGKIKEFESVK